MCKFGFRSKSIILRRCEQRQSTSGTGRGNSRRSFGHAVGRHASHEPCTPASEWRSATRHKPCSGAVILMALTKASTQKPVGAGQGLISSKRLLNGRRMVIATLDHVRHSGTTPRSKNDDSHRLSAKFVHYNQVRASAQGHQDAVTPSRLQQSRMQSLSQILIAPCCCHDEIILGTDILTMSANLLAV